MGQASEMMIEELNVRYETDEEFRREYDERMQMDAALEAEWFEQEREREKSTDWFPDFRLDHTGYEEIDEPEIRDLSDEDLPF